MKMFVSNDINILGETVTIKHVTATTRNEYGDITQTTSNTTAVAIIRKLTGDDLQYLQAGADIKRDMVGFFKNSNTIAADDLVTYSSNDYVVRQYKPLVVNGNTIGYECLLKFEE